MNGLAGHIPQGPQELETLPKSASSFRTREAAEVAAEHRAEERRLGAKNG